MSVFEELRPFVSLCQACGMIPYSIKNNVVTNKFAGFTLAFNRLPTWWFCFLFILQLAISAVLIQFSGHKIYERTTEMKDLPMAMTILSGMTLFSYLVQLFLSRWVVFHYRKLNNLVQTVQKVENLFDKKFLAQHKSSVMLRFVIGFILVMSTNIGVLFLWITSMKQSFFPANMDIFLLSIGIAILILVMVMMECTFFFIHMCYYIIAHYIELIYVHPKDGVQNTWQKSSAHIKILRRDALIFHYLCFASSELNAIFSIPSLLLLILKFISIVTTAYFYTYSLINLYDVLENGRYYVMFLFLMECARMLVLLTAADLPANEVRLLRERIIAKLDSGLFETLTEKITAMTFLLHVNEDLVRLSANGVFKVGVHLIPALTGAAVTYMAILLQN